MEYQGKSHQWSQVLNRLGFSCSFKCRSSGVIVLHCLFHSERTPSLHLYPQSMRAYCYGCGQNLSVVEFVAKYKEYKDYLVEDRQALQDFFRN